MSSDNLLRLLTQKMAYLSQRQSVLAENVANANTPGFKAKDLAPFSFGDALKQASAGSFYVTDPKHIIPASMAGVNAKTVKDKQAETLPDGNSVDIEQQMMNVSQTAVDYKAMTSIYQQIVGWFRIAVKGN